MDYPRKIHTRKFYARKIYARKLYARKINPRKFSMDKRIRGSILLYGFGLFADHDGVMGNMLEHENILDGVNAHRCARLQISFRDKMIFEVSPENQDLPCSKVQISIHVDFTHVNFTRVNFTRLV